MNFKLDENLPVSSVRLLAKSGHHMDTVAAGGLTRAADPDVVASAVLSCRGPGCQSVSVVVVSYREALCLTARSHVRSYASSSEITDPIAVSCGGATAEEGT